MVVFSIFGMIIMRVGDRMQKNIILSIQEHLGELKKSEATLATWVLKNLSRVVHMSVQEVSKEARTSPATIIRLCKSLGLEGFTDLKLRLSAQLPQLEEEIYTEIVKDEKISQIKKKLNVKVAYAFEETNELLENQMIEKAVAAIDQAELIYCAGVGASSLVAEDIYQKLTRIGKMVYHTMDFHLMATSFVAKVPKKVLILVSNSGETSELCALAQVAKESATTIIVITKNKESTLAQQSDVLLLTASGEEASLRSAATSSLLVQLYTVDILFTAYASKNYAATIEQLEKTKKSVQKWKEYKIEGKKYDI
ncbi:hypothetical protein CBF30_11680 [Vagococcus entomophilus]|uniref:RpiR family transcriptional regulator n=2 Tax=Vagococcus entomophilus TaxID=1160095 RepID=A0A430AEV4_9ENTE|nr:hypothetical protein CBF30_11680 [Vagococcus entomophilus]